MDLERFFNNDAEWDLAGWMREHLQSIDPRLMWEYGPGANRGHRLVITPEGAHHLRPLVDEIIARAPQLPDWLFFNHRTPEPVGHMARTVHARSGVEPAFTAVALAPGRAQPHRLTFQFPAGFLEYQRPVAHTQAVVAAEALLGEDLLGDWLGKLDAEARVAHPLPPSALPRAFAALAGTQRAKLPAEPLLDLVDCFAAHHDRVEPQASRGLRASLRSALGAHPAPELWRNAHSDQRFWPGRFTRCGETFCYLKIDRGEMESDPRLDHHVRFETPLDGALRSRRYGCVIGAGTGLRYTYVDLAHPRYGGCAAAPAQAVPACRRIAPSMAAVLRQLARRRVDRHVARQPATADALERLAFESRQTRELETACPPSSSCAKGTTRLHRLRYAREHRLAQAEGALLLRAGQDLRFSRCLHRHRRLCRAQHRAAKLLSRDHAEHIKLDTPADIFETWREMHKILREEYHMNPRRESDDAYETTRMTALIANPHGIFGVTPARDVESYPRFWAVGSGAPFALGALFTLYERDHDVEEIARAGVAAGAEFDEGSELPIVAHRVKLS